MNEARGEGLDVCLELPKILREFSMECRREGVRVGRTLDLFGCRYFAEKAGMEVEGGREKTILEEEEKPPVVDKDEDKVENEGPKPAESVKVEDPFSPAAVYFSGQRIVPNTLNGTHDLSVFSPSPEKLTFALRNKATGKIHASELTPATLPPVLPTSLTPTAFWKALNTLPPDAASFSEKEYPSPLLCILIEGCKVDIPMADMGDSDVSKEYFEDPYM